MKRLKGEWLQIVILLAPFCAAALLWDRLPERMPIHWNAAGEVDGYAGKGFAAFFTPVVNLVVVLLMSALIFIDPRIRKADEEGRANFRRVVRALRLAFTTFIGAVGIAVICIGAGLALDMSRVIGIGLAVLFGVLGNFLGKVRPNYLVGVRTPWTLESREVWIKTHRFTGRLMVGGAVVMLVTSLVLAGGTAFWVNFSLIMLICFIAIVYSFIAYRKQERRPHGQEQPAS